MTERLASIAAALVLGAGTAIGLGIRRLHRDANGAFPRPWQPRERPRCRQARNLARPRPPRSLGAVLSPMEGYRVAEARLDCSSADIRVVHTPSRQAHQRTSGMSLIACIASSLIMPSSVPPLPPKTSCTGTRWRLRAFAGTRRQRTPCSTMRWPRAERGSKPRSQSGGHVWPLRFT